MKSKMWPLIVAPALAAACAPEGESASNFVLVADVQQIMANVIDPAADVYWDAVGTIVDRDGVHEIYPNPPRARTRS